MIILLSFLQIFIFSEIDKLDFTIDYVSTPSLPNVIIERNGLFLYFFSFFSSSTKVDQLKRILSFWAIFKKRQIFLIFISSCDFFSISSVVIGLTMYCSSIYTPLESPSRTVGWAGTPFLSVVLPDICE
jgi:hypothetical protein